MTREYTAADGILSLIYSLNNGPAHGTGVKKLSETARNLLGHDLPPAVVVRAASYLNNLYGNYPTRSDIAPSIVFCVIFFVIGICHLTLFLVNFSRGHFFYISFLWFLYGMGKTIGFALRAVWATDVTLVDTGIAGEVFLIIFAVFLTTINLILAQRLFSWRHPVGGARRLFNYTMFALYCLVALVVVLTIVSSAVPYLYYLSARAYRNYQICVMTSAVLIFLYSLTAVSLLALSYFFKPTRKDENLYTYQPWWIESFSPFYFVKKNAARDAEETFMKRNHNHRHAIRVIAATHHHYNMVEGLTNQRGTLEHNKSIIIVTITTLLTMAEAVLRGIVCFQTDQAWVNRPLARPIVAYMTWGVAEVLVNVLYLVGRVDLRFYRPDILPARVRAIITAEQSFFASRNQSRHASQQVSDVESDEEVSDFEFESPSSSPISSKAEPPHYARDEKKYETSSDNESEFNF
ncbi:hypothetical protein CLIB1444_01S07844 [[Candida] jaroonii]|uniref:Uncharacterized protein n=1 Tax=[Candida] jaroonii TaxID=467808 RepID=A0ACA9Y0M1_9ASCO|nr:hypothetical protein CLIB1444_01S07844 [[Candida] jaroonii]